MKLYTEQDLRKVVSIFSEEYKTTTDEILNELNLTPIQLPTDDELLYDATTWLHNKFNGKGIEFKIYDREKNEAYNYNPVKLLKEYSIWMRNKIQGGNNETI